jgi:esterase
MELHYKQYSTEGPALLILHGLFGSLGNWGGHATRLAEHYAVIGVDLRNHGNSPHSREMSYRAMAADVLELMDRLGLASAHLLGHSMGGKVAMQLALDHPQRVNRLVIADIAPVRYAGEHDGIFAGLQAVDLKRVSTRSDADRMLADHVDDEVVRQFLLTNLQRDSEGNFHWRINLPVLAESYRELRDGPAGQGVFERPTLFIKGDQSAYITEAHRDEIMRRFPQARLKVIMHAGHWLHAEKPQTFLHLVLDFLDQAD